MSSSITPTHEAQRLADLRALRVLDTPPERRFDRIVDLAARVFDVPIAYVALIDRDRQWFKAQVGLSPRETSRSSSFCGHTILQDEPLVVPDAASDPRFRDNPMVVNEPYIRFYAGHPLKGPGGFNVATLCLASPEPRSFAGHDWALFRQIAGLAEHELNLVDLVDVQRQMLNLQRQLVATQRRLEHELSEAAEYVRSLLPDKLPDGPVRTDYRFITSSRLGGDLFGYHWLDDRQLALYLLDVTGHGLAASLLSASVHAALSPRGLLAAPLDQPAEVLHALNRAFPMEKTGNRFFTIWYGVYDRDARELRYASAGHPPAIALDGRHAPLLLGEPSYMIGIDPAPDYVARTQPISGGSRLYVFSDGAIEARNTRGQMLRLEGLVALLADAHRRRHPSPIDQILDEIRLFQARDDFADDLSLLEVAFG